MYMYIYFWESIQLWQVHFKVRMCTATICNLITPAIASYIANNGWGVYQGVMDLRI